MTFVFLLLLHVPLIQAILLAHESLHVNKRDSFFSWQYPPNPGADRDYSDDLPFPLGSTQRLKWEPPTNISEYNIAVLQDATFEPFIIYKKSSSDEEMQEYNWTVTTGGANLDTTRVFYFWAHGPEMEWPEGWTSHYFDITEAEVSSSSISTASTVTGVSTLTSTSAMTTLPSTSTPSTTPTSSNAPTQSPHSGSNNKLALGLGLGLGIPLVLLIGIYVGAKLVQARRSHTQRSSLHPPETYSAVPMKEQTQYNVPEYVPPAELPTGTERHQMP